MHIRGVPHARAVPEPTPHHLMLLIRRSCATIVLLSGFLQGWAANVPSVTIGQNFTGSTYGANSQAIPSDANGVIGPRHFVEFINGTFAVYNKTNHQTVKRIADTKFWSNAGLVLASSDGITDPRIIYDPV